MLFSKARDKMLAGRSVGNLRHLLGWLYFPIIIIYALHGAAQLAKRRKNFVKRERRYREFGELIPVLCR